MNKTLSGNQVRQLFLDFFTSKDHMIEPGASLIPQDDPTLLWINAGVAPLKKYFDGSERPRKNRIANVQKSIRTNDIENVGKTARHHTFFEMLGNFSIGDYFKKEAIPFAWEFLTSPEWIGIDPEKLYISVYKDDEEAYRIWTEVCKVSPDHILKTEDNFWEIGAGPGGPDTEIFYDRGEKYDPEGLGEKLFFEEMENDRFVEVWNVVFSQYDCNPEIDRKDYQELPQKNIDTGMGLERLVALLQDAETNFDTDLFAPILKAIEQRAGKPYKGSEKMAYRVIADHIRTLVFALSDGAGFSNSGRGYVLRRLLRRAARYGMTLEIEGTFLSDLVDSVIEAMGEFYPDIAKNAGQIKEQILREERAFKKVLNSGYELLEQAMEKAETNILDGEVVFKLYDTYGFPLELTEEIAQEKGFSVDREGFEKEMALQKERARNARNVEDSFASQNQDLMNFNEPSEFIGYETMQAPGKILALFQDGKRVDTLTGKGEMILDPTIFYALSGGQVADTGLVESKEATALVQAVSKARNGQHLISVEVVDGEFREGEEVEQSLDLQRRKATTSNHSATHLLQSALKKVIGDQIAQQGSYVGPDYLRFDFNHPQKLSAEELEAIETLINEMIFAGYPVTKEIMPIEEARKKGATALFNEKYGDEVRVVTMGDVSMEFCGGCHVNNTSEIGLCKIISEESVGSNIRRITAVTGMDAYKNFQDQQRLINEIAAISKSKNLKALSSKIGNDYDQLHHLQKENADLQAQIAAQKSARWIDNARQVGKFRLILLELEDQNGKQLKDQVMNQIHQHPDLAVVVLNKQKNGNANLILGLGKDLEKKGISASDLLKQGAALMDGKGGGKKDFAQGGVRNLSRWPEVKSLFERTLQENAD